MQHTAVHIRTQSIGIKATAIKSGINCSTAFRTILSSSTNSPIVGIVTVTRMYLLQTERPSWQDVLTFDQVWIASRRGEVGALLVGVVAAPMP